MALIIPAREPYLFGAARNINPYIGPVATSPLASVGCPPRASFTVLIVALCANGETTVVGNLYVPPVRSVTIVAESRGNNQERTQ